MHAALAGEVSAAQRDQVLLLILQLAQIMAEAFEHKVLEIQHPIAGLAARCTQQGQGVGMMPEEIGMFTQIGDDIFGAGRARLPRRRDSADERLWQVLWTIGHR